MEELDEVDEILLRFRTPPILNVASSFRLFVFSSFHLFESAAAANLD